MTQSAPTPLPAGLLIVFEGLDGAGKSTQIDLLAKRLRRSGYDVICLKEPTDGPWGQKLRSLTRQARQQLSPSEELAWFMADRRDNVAQHIRPALARGQIVLLDRYYFSTIAYQGALGHDPEALRQQNEAFAPAPDLVILLDIPPAVGLQRVRQQRRPDGFEDLAYLERVAALFDGMRFPYLRRIAATPEPEAVQARIWQEVWPLLSPPTPSKPAADRKHERGNCGARY